MEEKKSQEFIELNEQMVSTIKREDELGRLDDKNFNTRAHCRCQTQLDFTCSTPSCSCVKEYCSLQFC